MLHGKYKEDFNCRHCELAYKRVKEWAEKAKFDITHPYIDFLSKRTKSLRIYEMIREAYTLGMARGILMVDSGHNKITLSEQWLKSEVREWQAIDM